MADLRLANSVDASEPLLDAVRVPGQVVVHHEVRSLQVDALTGSVGCDEYAHVLVLLEHLLCAVPLLTRHATFDGEHCVVAPQKRADLRCQVLKRVLVLGEDDQLLPAPIR